MSGMRKEQRDQAAQEPPRAPFALAPGSLPYTRQMRRRNRRYRNLAALLVLGAGIGVVVVLLANWLATLIR